MIAFICCCFVYLLFLLFLLVGHKCRGRPGKFTLLEDAAELIWSILQKRRILPSKSVEQYIQSLYPGRNRKTEVKAFYLKKLRLVFLTILAGNSLAFFGILSSFAGGMLIENTYINKNSYGKGPAQVRLEATLPEYESRIPDISIMVSDRKYEEAALITMAEDLIPMLNEIILGSNTSLNEVRYPLNLIQSVEEYPFTLQWESNDYSILSSDGSIQNELIPQEGTPLVLTVILSYEDFVRQQQIPVRVLGPILSVEEQWKKQIGETLMKENDKQIHNEQLHLPDQIGGKTVTWTEVRENDGGMLLLLVPAVAFFLYFAADQDLQRKIQDRERQMLIDYPGIIQKLTLYMGAGMTVKSSFRKIAVDYRENVQKTVYRYAYEEMLLTCYELDNGMNEARAYEAFGKRCKMQQYVKLGSLLSQNLRRGNNGLLLMLKEEAKNAFEERKHTAKKLGEEAGTKLLLPMMLMLSVVMVLIMVPAYISFN